MKGESLFGHEERRPAVGERSVLPRRERPPLPMVEATERARLETQAARLARELEMQIDGMGEALGEANARFEDAHREVERLLGELTSTCRALREEITNLVPPARLAKMTELIATRAEILKLQGKRVRHQEPVQEPTSAPRKTLLERLRSRARTIALVAGLGGLGGGIARAVFTTPRGPERPTATDTSRDIPELPAGVGQYAKLAGLLPSEVRRDPEREASNEQLTKLIKEAMKAGLAPGSSIPDSCTDALQCFLFYDGQLNFSGNKELMAAISAVEGIDAQELRFLKSVIQTGYLGPAPRFAGTITQREPWAIGHFPSAAVSVQENKRRREEFFNRELYGQHVEFVLAHARSFDLAQGTPAERAQVTARLSDIVRLRNKIAMQDLVVWKNHQSPSVYRITKRSGNTKASRQVQQALLADHRKKIGQLFDWYAQHSKPFRAFSKDQQRAARVATQRLFDRAEHGKTAMVLRSLVDEARKGFITRWVADEVEPTLEEQLQMIAEVDRELRTLPKGPAELASR